MGPNVYGGSNLSNISGTWNGWQFAPVGADIAIGGQIPQIKPHKEGLDRYGALLRAKWDRMHNEVLKRLFINRANFERESIADYYKRMADAQMKPQAAQGTYSPQQGYTQAFNSNSMNTVQSGNPLTGNLGMMMVDGATQQTASGLLAQMQEAVKSKKTEDDAKLNAWKQFQEQRSKERQAKTKWFNWGRK